jgi:hypothetical protein
MKKAAILMLIFARLGAALSAEIFSAGAGFTGTNNWITDTIQYPPSAGSGADQKQAFVAGGLDAGGFLFLDATYAEFDVIIGSGAVYAGEHRLPKAVKFGLAFFAKYPFPIGAKGLSFGPVMGLQYDMAMAALSGDTLMLYQGKKNGDAVFKAGRLPDLNTLSLKTGLEAKFPVTKRLFCSAQCLWVIEFGNQFTSASQKEAKDYTPQSEGTLFIHGTSLKLGVGRRF